MNPYISSATILHCVGTTVISTFFLGVYLQITPARPRQLRKMTKRLKRVTRAYGGCLSAAAVRERIIRAFLIEEQKIVARVLKAKSRAEKK